MGDVVDYWLTNSLPSDSALKSPILLSHTTANARLSPSEDRNFRPIVRFFTVYGSLQAWYDFEGESNYSKTRNWLGLEKHMTTFKLSTPSDITAEDSYSPNVRLIKPQMS